MGARINFFINNSNKRLTNLIHENYVQFSKWYIQYYSESYEEYHIQKIINFINTHHSLHINNTAKKIVDEITSEFIIEYFDLPYVGPSVNKWRYNSSTQLVKETNNKRFIALWNALIVDGRSLKDKEHFDSYSHEFKTGFLYEEEYLELKKLILKYFGDYEAMKKKFWSIGEKKVFKEASKNSKNGCFTLSDHNPITSGLQYVLQTIDEIKESKNDLISSIE